MNSNPTPEPIRKSLLPCTPPAEWEFHTVLGARSDTEGVALFPGDAGPVVIRRQVTYGGWEPVRPERWAQEPEAEAPAVSPAVGQATRDRIAEIERLREQLEEAEDTAEQLVRNVQTVARERESYRKAWREEQQRRVKAEAEKKPADRLRAVVARVAQMADAWEQQLPEVIRTPAVVSAIRAALEAADDPSRLADEAQQPEPPAAECSAQHRNFDDGRLCIRAAQHRGDHIDERGFHWSDTVAVYPVGGGTFQSGVRPSAVGARQPDTETLPMLFWDESAGVVHHDGRIAIWINKALNLAQFAPAGQLVLQVQTAGALRRALTSALTEAYAASSAVPGRSAATDTHKETRHG